MTDVQLYSTIETPRGFPLHPQPVSTYIMVHMTMEQIRGIVDHTGGECFSLEIKSTSKIKMHTKKLGLVQNIQKLYQGAL